MLTFAAVKLQTSIETNKEYGHEARRHLAVGPLLPHADLGGRAADSRTLPERTHRICRSLHQVKGIRADNHGLYETAGKVPRLHFEILAGVMVRKPECHHRTVN